MPWKWVLPVSDIDGVQRPPAADMLDMQPWNLALNLLEHNREKSLRSSHKMGPNIQVLVCESQLSGPGGP